MLNTSSQTVTNKETKKPIDYLPAAFMLLFLLSGFIMTLVTPSTYNLPEDKNMITGEWATAYEAQFNESIPFRPFAIDTWGVMEYIAFKEGRKGVLVGSEGWLYTNEEFLSYPNSDIAFQNKIDLAIQAKEQLAEQNTNFIVVVIPAKSRVYPEYLGKYDYPSYNQTLYDDFVTALEEKGIVVASLLNSLQEAKLEKATFLRTDTHWTPFGAKVAAEAIAQEVSSLQLLPSFGSSDFQTETLENVEYKGDLLSYLPLGILQERLGPAFDLVQEKDTEQQGGGLGLFGSESIPVTLLGTSYSANANWHFEGALKQALGADVLNLADEGLGPVIPLKSYLESQEFRDNPPELVIWEVPERFVSVKYE